jgi:hypothetical protein
MKLSLRRDVRTAGGARRFMCAKPDLLTANLDDGAKA